MTNSIRAGRRRVGQEIDGRMCVCVCVCVCDCGQVAMNFDNVNFLLL